MVAAARLREGLGQAGEVGDHGVDAGDRENPQDGGAGNTVLACPGGREKGAPRGPVLAGGERPLRRLRVFVSWLVSWPR